jgi:hypothetical protein
MIQTRGSYYHISSINYSILLRQYLSYIKRKYSVLHLTMDSSNSNGYDIDKVKNVVDTIIEKLHTQLREVNRQVTTLAQLITF